MRRVAALWARHRAATNGVRSSLATPATPTLLNRTTMPRQTTTRSLTTVLTSTPTTRAMPSAVLKQTRRLQNVPSIRRSTAALSTRAAEVLTEEDERVNASVKNIDWPQIRTYAAKPRATVRAACF
jgi:hypothetical protein